MYVVVAAVVAVAASHLQQRLELQAVRIGGHRVELFLVPVDVGNMGCEIWGHVMRPSRRAPPGTCRERNGREWRDGRGGLAQRVAPGGSPP